MSHYFPLFENNTAAFALKPPSKHTSFHSFINNTGVRVWLSRARWCDKDELWDEELWANSQFCLSFRFLQWWTLFAGFPAVLWTTHVSVWGVSSVTQQTQREWHEEAGKTHVETAEEEMESVLLLQRGQERLKTYCITSLRLGALA